MPIVIGENVKLATTWGDVAATLTVLDVAADWPTLLVTLSVTAYVPDRAYRCVTVIPVPLVPSPKSQTKLPLLTFDVEALKKTS